MKIIATLFSTAAIGFLFGSPSLTLLHELQQFAQNKRRLLWAFVFGAAAFIFAMSAILFSAYEKAVQFDEQGFVLWNSIFTLSVGLICAAVLCGIFGKMLLPKPVESGLFSSSQFGEIQNVVEDLISQFMEPRTRAPDSERRSGPDRSEVADYGQPEYTTH